MDILPAIDAARVEPERIVNGIVADYGIITDGWGIPFMMAGLILLCMCIGVYVITSLVTPAPTAEELEKMGWKPPFDALKLIKAKTILFKLQIKKKRLGNQDSDLD